MVKLHLMESYCYPILSYSVECFNLTSSSVHQLDVCWNSVYQKLFDFKPWLSVRELIMYVNRISFEYLYYQKRLCFLHNMTYSENSLLLKLWNF